MNWNLWKNGRIKLRKSTITYMVILGTGALASQDDWVKAHVVPLVAGHPRLTPLVPIVLLFLSTLHQPVVLQTLETLAEEQKKVSPDGTVETSTKTQTLSTPVTDNTQPNK